MDGRLPLSALLSQALVAFIIEFDNEFEHQVPHRTTDCGSTPGAINPPFLLSMIMWIKFLQFIPDDGITVRELQLRLRATPKELQNWLTRLWKWWSYVFVFQRQSPAASKRIHPDAIVRPTPGGHKAFSVWRSLTGIIEKRWEKRFGLDTIQQLRDSLDAVVSHLDPALPDSLPILGYGLVSTPIDLTKRPPASNAVSEPNLPALLSKVLLAFTIDFEQASAVSLAIAANVLRLVGDSGVRVSDLPRLSGVSKEAIAMAGSFLEKRGFAIAGPDSPRSRIKMLRLTPKGNDARLAYTRLVSTIEENWKTRFGSEVIASLRSALEVLVCDFDTYPLPLFTGLQPYPDCWRAGLPAPEVIPHFPMILHRGGYPDGS
jgi:DNA-binding MarR family transcriptional regulator